MKKKIIITKKIKKTIRLMPDVKTKLNQVKKTNRVWPMSGCVINRNKTGSITNKLKKYLL